jgi:hypothetical protein
MDVNAANRLTLICINLPDIKYYAQDLLSREKTPTTIMEMMKLIRTAKETDSALEHWALTLSQLWEPRVIMRIAEEPEDNKTAQFWKGPVHVYTDLGMANVWNDYRVSRIFCQSVILGCVAALPAQLKTGQVQRVSAQAVSITQQMVDDFCSVVPYLFGIGKEFEAKKVSRLDQAGMCALRVLTYPMLIRTIALRATGAYYAAWPLWVTKEIRTISENQRDWLLSRLLFIGKTWGLSEDQVVNMAQRHAMTAGPQFSYEAYEEARQPFVSPRPCGAEYASSLIESRGNLV